MVGRRLIPNSDAWGGAWGAVSAWGGTWGWSWGPLHEVDDGVIRKGSNPWRKKRVNDDEEIMEIIQQFMPAIVARVANHRRGTL